MGVVLMAGLGYAYQKYREAAQAGEAAGQAFVEAIRHPKPTAAAPVNPIAWNQIHVGMSKAEVVGLLGEAPGRMEYDESPVGYPSQREHVDFWEYGYVSGLGVPVPDDRAHVVYFDAAGRVASFRQPKQPKALGDSRSER